MLQTRRLELIPATLVHLAAELQQPTALGPLLGVPIPGEWPPGEYDHQAVEYFHQEMERGGAALLGWLAWYAVTRDPQGRRQSLVASAGYFGPPSAGSVEIGYSVLPSARRQGYAVEIVQALVERAFQEASVRQVLAHTTDANLASTRVLLRSGFQRIGPQEGGAIRYRRGR